MAVSREEFLTKRLAERGTELERAKSNERLYFDALKKIARGYQTIAQLRRRGGQYGLDASEEIEMAYENIQIEAARAIRGKRRPKAA